MARVVDRVGDVDPMGLSFVDMGCIYAVNVLGRSLKSWALKNMSRGLMA